MVVGVLQLELLLHGPQGLKEKRSLVKKLVARLRNRFPVSVAEVGLQDAWQRACIGVVMVSAEAHGLDGFADRIENEVSSSGLAETGPRQFEILHY